MVAGELRGATPNATSSSPPKAPTASFAASHAWPVPSAGFWTTMGCGFTASATASMPSPTTTAMGSRPSGLSVSSRCAIIGRPASGCRTFGKADFIRVPRPAERMTAAVFVLVMS